MQIIRLDPVYLNFLRQADSRVPEKHRLWAYPVPIQGTPYAVPLTSLKPKHEYANAADFLLLENAGYGLNINNMVPIRPEAVIEVPAQEKTYDYYRNCLAAVQSQERMIERTALSLWYQLEYQVPENAVQAERLEKLRGRCCDWKKLEQAADDCPRPFSLHRATEPPRRLHYTREQYEQAKYNSSALEYAQSQGYELVKEGGGYYRMKEHDSMIFTPQGSWFWNSRGLHGGAIEFQIYYENKTVPEAVLTLCGENVQQNENRPRQEADTPPKPQENPKEAFRLPFRAKDNRRLLGYLCGTRKISKDVVLDMLRQGVLYESVNRLPNGHEINNACFVSYGPDGQPCGAYQRGMSSYGEPFKREIFGSNKRYGWVFHMNPNVAPEAVAVFEASIDAASYATMCRTAGPQAGSGMDLLALGGLDGKALDNYLAAHPNIKDVLLCLDNDQPGRTAASAIQHRLKEQGYAVVDSSAALGEYKDWNELLVAESQPEPAPQNEPAPEPVPEMEP